MTFNTIWAKKLPDDNTKPKIPNPKHVDVHIEESINKQIIEASLNRGCKCQKKKS